MVKINALLKEYLAPETNPKIGTTKLKAYSNDKVKFLKFIDTRGVELIKNYGNDNIENKYYKLLMTQIPWIFLNGLKRKIIMIISNVCGIV